MVDVFSDAMLVQLLGGKGLGKNQDKLPYGVRNIIRDNFLAITVIVATFRDDYFFPRFFVNDGLFEACKRIISHCTSANEMSDRGDLYPHAFAYLQSCGWVHKLKCLSHYPITIAASLECDGIVHELGCLDSKDFSYLQRCGYQSFLPSLTTNVGTAFDYGNIGNLRTRMGDETYSTGYAFLWVCGHFTGRMDAEKFASCCNTPTWISNILDSATGKLRKVSMNTAIAAFHGDDWMVAYLKHAYLDYVAQMA